MPRIFRCFAAVYNKIVHITVGFQKFVHLFGSSRHFFILCSINNYGRIGQLRYLSENFPNEKLDN